MKNLNKVYCEFCEEDTNHTTIKEDETININGIEITFNKIKNHCINCNNEIYIESDNIINVKYANMEYRKNLV